MCNKFSCEEFSGVEKQKYIDQVFFLNHGAGPIYLILLIKITNTTNVLAFFWVFLKFFSSGSGTAYLMRIRIQEGIHSPALFCQFSFPTFLNHWRNSKLSWNLPLTSLSTGTILSTFIFLKAACSTLKLLMYSCSNFVLNFTCRNVFVISQPDLKISLSRTGYLFCRRSGRPNLCLIQFPDI